MTEMFGVPETATPGSTEALSTSEATATGSGQSTTDTAKEQVSGVAHEGVRAGKHVASVAGDQAKEVASEAGHQARTLVAEAKSELLSQASSQQQRVAGQLHGLSQQLGSMASTSEQDGLATSLAQQASRHVGTVAHWVSEREPASLVRELKDFARNKPGTFLALAAGVGMFAGRMTRGVNAGVPADGSGPGTTSYPSQQGISPQAWETPPAQTAVLPIDTPNALPPSGVGLLAGDWELTDSLPARSTGMAQ